MYATPDPRTEASLTISEHSRSNSVSRSLACRNRRNRCAFRLRLHSASSTTNIGIERFLEIRLVKVSTMEVVTNSRAVRKPERSTASTAPR